MRRAQDRARSASSRKNGARSATFKNSGTRSATIEYYGARSATIESRALGVLKLPSAASCARSAQWECAREAGTFFSFSFLSGKVLNIFLHRNFVCQLLLLIYLLPLKSFKSAWKNINVENGKNVFFIETKIKRGK